MKRINLLISFLIIFQFLKSQGIITAYIEPAYITENDSVILFDSMGVAYDDGKVNSNYINMNDTFILVKTCASTISAATMPSEFSQRLNLGKFATGTYTLQNDYYVTRAFQDTFCGHSSVKKYDSVTLQFTVHAQSNGLSEALPAMQWQLSPNPITNELRLKLDRNISGQLMFIDATGKKVKSAMLNHQYELAISVADIPAGVYIALLQTEGCELRKRIVKY